MASVSRTILGLDVVGGLLLADWLFLAGLSHSDQQPSIWLFLLLLGLAWVGVLLAWQVAREVTPRSLLPRLWLWAVMFRLAGLFGDPVLEDDYYRYLWDGRQFAITGNPYASAPSHHFGEANLPAPFQHVLTHINYPEVPTIYAPVNQVLFLLSYWIAPGQLWPLKLLLILADLLTVQLLLDLAKPRHALLYAWCPLLIKETAFTAHPDSLGVFFLVAGLHAAQYGRYARMAVLGGLAAGSKVFALVPLPLLLARVSRRYWALFLGTLLAAYLPFWLQGSTADLAGLAAFLKYWEFNSSLYAILSAITGPVAAKMLCVLMFGGAWTWYFIKWRRATPERLPRGDVVFACFFLLSATVNAWYLLWLLPFVVLFRTAVGVTALAAVSLSYLTGTNLGVAALGAQHPFWVRPVEYGAVAAACCAAWLCRRSRRSAQQEVPNLGSAPLPVARLSDAPPECHEVNE